MAGITTRGRGIHHGTGLLVIAAYLYAITLSGQTQFPTPPFNLPGTTWNGGTHHYTALPEINCPDDPEPSMAITSDADAEFVSGTAIHLKEGFHAGAFNGSGQFHAYIGDGFGDPAALVLISPGADTSISEGTVHVHQWEKLELGLELPTLYQAAVDSFFTHYYSNGPEGPATPGMVDAVHDLNPYADDSLQLVMILTTPSGQQTLKWGFFMREAKWADTDPLARMVEDTLNAYHPYHVRFRIAPEEIGLWHFSLRVSAPHTLSPENAPLPVIEYPLYSFICDPPLADNHGFLQVNGNNHRTLRFDDDTHFFGMGVNMADQKHGNLGIPDSLPKPQGWWYTYYQRDHSTMLQTMDMLSSVGGNFMRMMLFKNSFAPEWVNLGVYDQYLSPPMCAWSESTDNDSCALTWTPDFKGNGQYQSWAFDRMLDKAREAGIYIQLCVDPNMPTAAFEKYLWGDHPHVIAFLERTRVPGAPYDMKHYFYADADPAVQDSGAFYYWKRKYKYILSRWGYSVNLAVIEPFNEMDQLLTYGEDDLNVGTSALPGCETDAHGDVPHNEICRENRIVWPNDPLIPGIVDRWFTDLIGFVRDPVDPGEPITSSLGDRRPFLISYTGAVPHTDTAFYRPLRNPLIDLNDMHQYAFPNTGEQHLPDWRIKTSFDVAQNFRNNYPAGATKKPFGHGEYSYSTNIVAGPPGHTESYEIEKFFHNYDVSFHNELWATAFSGNFATGLSWHWDRVFWWEDALEAPPDDFFNSFQNEFSNEIDSISRLDVGLQYAIPIKNRRLHHHFRPLKELLEHPSWASYDFFSSEYSAHKVFDGRELSSEAQRDVLESYYLKSLDSTAAIGWVHNRNAWVMKTYYLDRNTHNFLVCEAPGPPSDTLKLPGFAPGSYFVSWFPTRLNSTFHPPQMELQTDLDTLEIPLAGYFGGVSNNYLDTLRSDYTFIITPGPFMKRLHRPSVVEQPVSAGWDFGLYPNPTRDGFYLAMQDEVPKEIALFDLAGRRITQVVNVTDLIHYFSVEHLAMGTYWVRVSNGTDQKVKKLMVH
ncbi:MAG TPA: T9SS type A sorting domain-containing protein [Flavobacteriales bacterium]|nr:T9SS type A sorting domain-containing protein [Flavobacteriales bacterium]